MDAKTEVFDDVQVKRGFGNMLELIVSEWSQASHCPWKAMRQHQGVLIIVCAHGGWTDIKTAGTYVEGETFGIVGGKALGLVSIAEIHNRIVDAAVG